MFSKITLFTQQLRQTMVDMYKQVADTTAFVRIDGSRLRSLKALEMALLTMPESEYSHHVGADKNDFANWVEHVFGLRDLANKLRSATSRVEMLASLDNAGRVQSFQSKSASASMVLTSVAAQSIPKNRSLTNVIDQTKKVISSVSSSKSTSSSAAKNASTSAHKNSKSLHHKLKGIFKKGEEPVPNATSEPIGSLMGANDFANASDSTSTSDSNGRHPIHAQIEHLDRELAHMTRHHMHTTSRTNVGSAALEESVKERILDFSLGLIVGLMLGFILAKSFGM